MKRLLFLIAFIFVLPLSSDAATFGYTSVGVTTVNIADSLTGSSSVRYGQALSNVSSGDVTAIQAAHRTFSGTTTADVTVFINEEDTATFLHNEIAEVTRNSGEEVYTTTSQFYTYPVSGVSIVPDDYILSVVADYTDITANILRVSYDTFQPLARTYTTSSSSYSGLLVSPWSQTEASVARILSMYLVYDCTDTCTETFYAPGTFQWTAPTGVTEVIAACWGAGGGGGAISTSGGAGGGGGAFASSTVPVTAGNTYNVRVGTGGAPDNGSWAEASSFSTSTCPDCVIASGGQGASPTVATTEGAGGPTASSTGTTKFAGGAGGDGNGTNDVGGGGGGAGGPNGAGLNGENTASASTTGGAGGAGNAGLGGAGGARSSGFGTSGTSNDLGGGGGGGANDSFGGVGGRPGGGAGGGETVGNSGGNGQCIITYTIPASGGGGGEGTVVQDIFWFD